MASISCEVEADPSTDLHFHWLLLSGSGELTSETVLNAYEHYQTKQSTVAPYTSFYHHFQTYGPNGLSSIYREHDLNSSSPNIQFSIEYMSSNNTSSTNTSNLWQSGQPPQTTSSQSKRVRSLAKYIPSQNTHYGLLQCWATNAVGEGQKQPCTFYVLAAAAPEPPVNCTINNVTISTLTFECVPGNLKKFFRTVLKLF